MMKVNKKQSTWNGLVKLFCNSSLRRLYKNYEEVYAEYQENQYNYYHAVEALIHRIHNSGLREKLDILNAVEETQKNLYYQLTQISIETSEFVDSGVFELPTDIWDDLLLRQKYDGIIEEIARISARLEVLREWEKTVLYQNNYALSDALFESVNLVGATCIGINSQKKFANMNFDVTIIDEAGQIQIHNALVPMSRSPKLIMLGDHKQIPPIANDYVMQRCSEDGVDTKLEEISLFEDIFTKLPDTNKVLLDTQFRMPAEIADILSEWFYEGKYLSGKNKQGIKPIFPEIFDACFIVVDTGDVDKRFEEKVVGYINRYEAEVISRLLRYMVNKEHPKHLDSTKIGVISPYGNQVKLLVSMLRKIAEIGKDASEIAATLDSFQGQERDVIIYSCTRSNQKPHDAKGRIGFLKELRRLNVALSRPKELLVFVGDIKFLSSCTYGEGEGSPKEFSQFIQLIMQRVNEGKGQYIKSGELLERIGEEIYG